MQRRISGTDLESKRQRLEVTQQDDDTAPIEEVDVVEPESPTYPYARLRSLQPFAPQYELRKDVNFCGRNPCCDIVVGDKPGNPPWSRMISKKHFVITQDSSKKVFIKDISLNGTFLNGGRLIKGIQYELKYGDVISFSNPLQDANYDVFLFSDLAAEALYPPQLTKYYLMTGVILGKGGFGHVELARGRSDTSIKYAVKELQKERFATNIKRRICKAEDIKNEVKLMMELDHPNIVRLLDFLDVEDTSYIVLEYVGGGEFFERIVDPRWDAKGLGESLGRFYAYQLISAVQYLHSRMITHRDIKPENILMLDRNDLTIAKLSDFGLAKSKAASTMKTFCGTPCYTAPEIIENERTPYRECVDIWSLGVVLFTAFSGYPPFSSEYDDMTLNEQIKKGRLILLQNWQNISELDQVAIQRMLSVDPLKRPTAKELLSMDWMHSPEAKKAKVMVEEYQATRVKTIFNCFQSLGTSDPHVNTICSKTIASTAYSSNT